MSITDELRGYAKGYELLVNYRLLEIADRIDAKYDELRDDLQRAKDDLLESEHDESRAWDRVRKVEADNDELRKLLLDFRDAMWDYGEWTEPFDERMLELGVFRGRR